MKKFLLSCLLLVLFCTDSSANHLLGAEITYQSLGNSKYRVYVKIYRDCNGVQVSQSPVKATSDSIQLVTNFAVKISSRDITPVAVGCSGSRCTGTYTYGFEEHIWSYDIDLSSYSDCSWTFSWEQGFRSGNIYGPSNEMYYVKAYLNKCLAPENSTPVYKTFPQILLCHGQDVRLSLGAEDTSSADSFVYSLVPALQDSVTPIAYSGSFSHLGPLGFLGFPNTSLSLPSGFHLNSVTGDLSFRPSQLNQLGSIVIEIEEWKKDSTGTRQLVGTSRRDWVVMVIACSNKVPSIPGITAYEFCAEDSSCIQFTTFDADSSDSTFINFINTIPGAAHSSSTASGGRAVGSFCWKPSLSEVRTEPYLFRAKVRDKACPIYGESVRTFSIYVRDSMSHTWVNAGNDTDINMGIISVPINATYNTNFGFKGKWRTLGDGSFGNPMLPSTNYILGTQDRKECMIRIVLEAGISSRCGTVTDTMVIYRKQTLFSAGADITGLKADSAQLNGSEDPNAIGDVEWLSLGDGRFDDSSELSPVYRLGTQDRKNCQVKLVMKNKGNACEQFYDTLVIERIEDSLSAGPDIYAPNVDQVSLDGIRDMNNDRKTHWITLGDGHFGDSSDMQSQYYFGAGDKQQCSVTLVLQNMDPSNCNINSDTILIFRSHPKPDAGMDLEYVPGDSVLLSGLLDIANGQSGYWMTYAAGHFVDSSLLNAVYVPDGSDFLNCSVRLYLVSNSFGVCPSFKDSMLIHQKELPVNAGADISAARDSFVMSGSTNTARGQAGYWSTLGDGHFSDSTDMNATYYLGANDQASCNAKLVLTSVTAASCDTKYDTVIITELPLPVVLSSIYDTARFDSVILHSQHGINHINWSSNGTGTFVVNQAAQEVYYRLSSTDKQMDSLILTGERLHCGSESDSLLLHPSQYNTSVPPNTTELYYRIYPNPAESRIHLEVLFEQSLRSVELYDLNGKLMYRTYFEEQTSKHTIDLGLLASGSYLLKMDIGGEVIQRVIQKQ